jgi:lipopolysaccharide export system permease protein
MSILHRYLLRQWLGALLLAVTVCTGLLLLGNLLKEVLGLLMAGQATLGLVLRGVGLLIPYVLVFALPMGALTAALLVFGRMSADQELTAARANGVGLMALAWPVVAVSLVLCGLCAWVNLDLAPQCRTAYKSLFREISQERSRTLITPGRFITEFPGMVLYVGRMQDETLEEVLFFQVQDGRKIRDIRAPRARFELDADANELRITFLDSRGLEWIPGDREGVAGEAGGDAGTEASGDAAGVWQPILMGELPIRLALPRMKRAMPSLSELTWRQLWAERAELRRLGVDEVTPLEVQMHRMVAFSFAAFGFTLVGVPLGVRAHRRETSVGLALAIGLVLVYYAFLIVARALETVPEAAPWVIVWMPNVLFQLLGAWFLWRVNRGR